MVTSKKLGVTVPVPCGRCPPCKHRRVNEWVFRMLEESKQHQYAHFVTLTYDTRFVPISENGFMTLNKRDFQLFMKRLREQSGVTGIKYYACGEYGSQTKRPHYHAIIYGIPDVTMYDQAWQLGQVHIGTVSGDSIAYTMKYMDKPNQFRMHARDDRVPEFPLMSKGIGSNYLTPEVVAYHKADLSRICLTRPGGHLIAMPKYYRKRIYDDDELGRQLPIIQSAVNQQVSDEKRSFDLKYAGTGYTFDQYTYSRRMARYTQFYSAQAPKRNTI